MKPLPLFLLFIFLQTAAAQVLSGTTANDDPSVSIDTQLAIEKFAQAVKSSQVHTVEILHIDTNTLFRASVSSAFLRQNFHYKLTQRHHITESELIKDFLNKIAAAKIKNGTTTADLRWGFVFSDKQNQRIFEIYFDRVGKRGILNGAPIEFGDELFLQWTVDTFRPLFR
jgi:hypothetical protein